MYAFKGRLLVLDKLQSSVRLKWIYDLVIYKCIYISIESAQYFFFLNRQASYSIGGGGGALKL